MSFPIQNCWFSIVMLVYQRVCQIECNKMPDQVPIECQLEGGGHSNKHTHTIDLLDWWENLQDIYRKPQYWCEKPIVSCRLWSNPARELPCLIPSWPLERLSCWRLRRSSGAEVFPWMPSCRMGGWTTGFNSAKPWDFLAKTRMCKIRES